MGLKHSVSFILELNLDMRRVESGGSREQRLGVQQREEAWVSELLRKNGRTVENRARVQNVLGAN